MPSRGFYYNNLLKEIELLYRKTKGNYKLYKDIFIRLLRGYYLLSHPYSAPHRVKAQPLPYPLELHIA